MGHVRDSCLFIPQLKFHRPQLLVRGSHLIPQHPALLDQRWPVSRGGFGNLGRNILLLSPDLVAAHDQFVAILPQTQDSVNVSLHATFAAIFDNFVPMIADELQIQH
jgi:hypothetical protein